jgi:septum site-determining protein MinC
MVFTLKMKKTIESSQKNDLKTGDLYTSLAKSVQTSKKENEQPIKQPVQTDSAEIVPNTVMGNAMYLKQTVRSGQSVRFDGHIIIYGNANPGSEIIASGDIIVLGTLRGLAHAGARGDETSQIVATNLKASQLRIASCIGMSDDDDKSKIYNEPEYACIVDGKIFIGSLKSRK